MATTEACPRRLPLFVTPQPLDDETGLPIIQKVFIANRGEIACRVIATCGKLQIKTVVPYVREDDSSRHLVEADEVIDLGSIDDHKINPFLNTDLLIKAALDSGAQAIHPGYGYLSENAEFAGRVREQGLLFVGPSPTAMSTLGDKRSSKEYLQENAPDVPLVPGFSGTSLSVQDLEKAAAEIGYPVILKASAGGGGKGMRIVREPSQLGQELARVQSEATRSFGSTDCILEKYIENSKHIEFQIIGDSYGNVVNFFDRDCSVQRRHQKIIEESPCPFLTDDVRQKMGQTAVRIASLIGYENAGTVEFIFNTDTSEFFFLEVNARLQVEHPITEEVTGVDLVALQLYVAAGGSLASLSQLQGLTQTGHTIECRLCAESPDRDFFPEHGSVYLWQPAAGDLGPGRDIRYETAIQPGSSVSIHFDSMIAKLVVWAPTRALAIQRMLGVLADTACVGVKTNQAFLQACLLHPSFRDPAYNTSFIPKHLSQLLHTRDQDGAAKLTVVPSLFIRELSRQKQANRPRQNGFPDVRHRFRNQRFDHVGVKCDIITTNYDQAMIHATETGSAESDSTLCFWTNASLQQGADHRYAAVAKLEHVLASADELGSSKSDAPTKSASQAITSRYNCISNYVRSMSSSSKDHSVFEVTLNDTKYLPQSQNQRSPTTKSLTLQVTIGGSKLVAHCVTPDPDPDSLDHAQTIYCHFPHLGTWEVFRRETLLSYIESCRAAVEVGSEAQTDVVAPMPCKVLAVQKTGGENVEIGDVVMVIESMKMEVSLKASKAGQFQTQWKAGDALNEGQVLFQVIWGLT